MGTYRPFFSVQVGHSYFASGQWRGLDFAPTPDTASLMKNADALAQPTNGGIAVFCNEDRADALRLFSDKADQSLSFCFKVNSTDRTFANYTAPTARDRNAILFFSNRGGITDPDKRAYRLSKDPFVSDKDLCNMDELVARGILSKADRRAPPDFVVEVLVDIAQNRASSGTGGDDGQASPNALDCYCNFSARSSFWRYFLLGSLGGNNPAIVDPDNRVVFEQCEDVLLAGNRPARVFVSRDAIPLQEMSTCRFQLKAQGNAGAKVLIKRLPAASKNRLGIDDINGKKQIVFENYINF
jgi:hypothetical protein